MDMSKGIIQLPPTPLVKNCFSTFETIPNPIGPDRVVFNALSGGTVERVSERTSLLLMSLDEAWIRAFLKSGTCDKRWKNTGWELFS